MLPLFSIMTLWSDLPSKKEVAIAHSEPDFDIIATLCLKRVGLVVIGV